MWQRIVSHSDHSGRPQPLISAAGSLVVRRLRMVATWHVSKTPHSRSDPTNAEQASEWDGATVSTGEVPPGVRAPPGVFEHHAGRRGIPPRPVPRRRLWDRGNDPHPRSVAVDGSAVGITCRWRTTPDHPDGAEIGGTLLAPGVWATGVDTEVKRLLLAVLFRHGAAWVQLRTDERNQRSAAAILKLGATEHAQPRVSTSFAGTAPSAAAAIFRIARPGTSPSSSRSSLRTTSSTSGHSPRAWTRA